MFLKRSVITVIFMIAGLGPVQSEASRSIRWGSPTWDHARLLPEGKSALEIKGQFQSEESVSTDGVDSRRINGLGNLSFQQTLGDLIEDSSNELQLLNMVEQESLDLNQVVSEAYLDVTRQYSESQIRWAHSLTSWWMLGFNIPIVRSRTEVAIRTRRTANGNESLESMAKGAREGELTVEKFQRMISELEWVQVSEEMNYEGIGGVELLNQLKIAETQQLYFSFRNRLLVPAGSNQTAYQPVPMGPDDGRLNIGADLMGDWSPSSSVILTGVFGYTWQVEDRVEARVPGQNNSSRWFWNIDPEVDRDLGDIILGQANGSINVWKRLWLTMGYEYRQKLKDAYEGGLFEEESYRAMEEGTDFIRETGRLGLRYQSALTTGLTGEKTYSAGIEYVSVLPSSDIPEIEATSLDVQVFF